LAACTAGIFGIPACTAGHGDPRPPAQGDLAPARLPERGLAVATPQHPRNLPLGLKGRAASCAAWLGCANFGPESAHDDAELELLEAAARRRFLMLGMVSTMAQEPAAQAAAKNSVVRVPSREEMGAAMR
jgi:hypothetical protein